MLNQSLIALLVNGTITYKEAIAQSPDPEDLSLKLRKMFPNIEERGGQMSPSTADFAEILMLQQYRKLYEEQEEKNKLRMAEKDDRIGELENALAKLDRDGQVLWLTQHLGEPSCLFHEIACDAHGRVWASGMFKGMAVVGIAIGIAGTLLMNRPKALNALTLPMIRAFADAIAAWKDDAACRLRAHGLWTPDGYARRQPDAQGPSPYRSRNARSHNPPLPV